MAGADRRDELAERLDAIAEELGDLALGALREAVDRGEDRRPPDERRLTQARRAVEKAAHLLRAPRRGRRGVMGRARRDRSTPTRRWLGSRSSNPATAARSPR